MDRTPGSDDMLAEYEQDRIDAARDRSWLSEEDDDEDEEWPPGTCPSCGHQWADHDERDGCGVCALNFTRSCRAWPSEEK